MRDEEGESFEKTCKYCNGVLCEEHAVKRCLNRALHSVRRQVCHASVLNEEHDSTTHACAKIVSAAVEPISRQGVRRAYALLMIPTYELRTYHFQADLTAARTSALALRLTIIICMREDACSMDMKFIATIQSQS